LGWAFEVIAHVFIVWLIEKTQVTSVVIE